ncbi:hypothetical protein C8Q80DRAFT_1347730 [Daedaleopsis nitida]|nr:hypothetical protein C8Q80DRAFT_1347730 [Daedaleopsis nitida]
MSSLSDLSDVAELTAYFNELRINAFCEFAAAAFFIYEFIVLFGSEVEYFWRSRITGASILFLLSRYLTLTYFLINVAAYLPVFTDNSVCNPLLNNLNTAFCRAFSALRAYALSRSRVWMTIVFILSLAPVGVNVTSDVLAHIGGAIDPVFGCVGTISVIPTPSEDAIELIISRGCLILADALLIGIMLWSTDVGSIGDNVLLRIIKPRSLQTLLVRDGTIYFIVLLVLNVLHLTFSLQTTFGSLDGGGSNIVIFTDPCTAVLVNRFLLHLQEAGSRTLRVNTEDPLHMESRELSTPSFVDRSILGSIGHRDHDLDVNSDNHAGEAESERSGGYLSTPDDRYSGIDFH